MGVINKLRALRGERNRRVLKAYQPVGRTVGANPAQQTLAEVYPGAVVTVDKNFNVVYANAFAETLLGALPPGTGLGQFFCAQDGQRLRQELAAFEGGDTRGFLSGSFETQITGRDRRRFDAEVSFCGHTEPAGSVWVLMIRDISLHKRTEKLAARQAALLRAINRVYDSAVSCNTHEELAQACLAAARDATGSQASWMLELGEDGRLREVAVSGAPRTDSRINDKRAHARMETPDALHGLCGSVVRSGQTLLTNDPPSHPDSARKPQGPVPVSAFLGVPIMCDGKATGLVAVANAAGGYHRAEQEMLEALTPAIREVCRRRQAEESARHSEFEHTVLSLATELVNMPLDRLDDAFGKAMEHVARYCGMDRASIYACDWERQIIRRLYGWDSVRRRPGEKNDIIPFSGIPEIIEHHKNGKPFYVNGIEDTPAHSPYRATMRSRKSGATANFPLMFGERVMGTVGFSTAKACKNWSAAELAAVEIFCQMIASVLVRREREQALEQANQINRLMLDSTYDGVAMVSRNGTVLTAGRVFAAQFGKTPQQIVGTNMQSYNQEQRHAAFAAKRGQKDRRVFDTGRAESYVDCRDGVWLDTRICPVVKDGEIVAVTIFSADITDRKRAAEEAARIARLEEEAAAMHQKEREYLETLDGATDGSWIMDLRTFTITYSEQWLARIGPEKARGRGYAEYDENLSRVHPDDRDRVHQTRVKLVESGQRVFELEYRYKTADGAYIWLLDRGKITYDESGAAIKAYGTSLDITKRKNTEEALRESELLLRTFMDNAADFMFIKDRDSRVVMVNEAYANAFGVSLSDVIGKNDYDLYGDTLTAKESLEHDRLVMQSGCALVCEESAVTKHGVKTYSLSKVPWRDTGGNILGVLGTAHDITDIKSAQQALVETVRSLQRSKECIELLYETTAKVLSSTAPRRDIDEICCKVMHFLDCDVFLNYLTEGDKPCLRLNACAGLADEQKKELDPLPFGTSVCGSAAQTRRRVVAESIQASDDVQTKKLKAVGLRAYACHPLLANGCVTGTLAFGTRVRDSFTKEELALMKTVADSASVAINRAQSEEALRASEKKYRTLFESMDEGFCVVDVIFEDGEPVDYRFIETNPAFGKQTGLSDAKGKRMRALAPDHEDYWFKIYGEVARTGRPVRFTNQAKALGRWFDVFAFQTDEQPSSHVAVLFNDITQRVRTEKALRQSEALLRDIIEGTSDPVFLKDTDGRFVACNAATGYILGVPANDLIGKRLDDVPGHKEPARAITHDRMVIETNTAHKYEESILTPEGVRIFHMIKTPWRDTQGRVRGLIGVARDISDRKRTEEALRQTAQKLEEKNALITDFFINISHEFKTPISVLQLAAEILEQHARRESLDPQLLDKYIAVMKQNTYRLSRLVGNLLDITKIDAGFMLPIMEPCDIVVLIRNLVGSVKPFAAKRGLKMAFLCGVKSKVVETDADYVERIVINLLSNAIKHTPRGGVVNVTCEAKGGSIVLSVRDNGEGIPDDKKEIIFNRFRQVNNSLARSNEGCGIGLSLCRSLAELLGGRVWLSSVAGRGSEFFVSLPATPAAKAPENNAQADTLQSRIQTEFSDIYF